MNPDSQSPESVRTEELTKEVQSLREQLKKGLALRDRYFQQEISMHGLQVATGRLAASMDRLLSKTYRAAANRRLAKHLRREQPWLWTFLHYRSPKSHDLSRRHHP